MILERKGRPGERERDVDVRETSVASRTRPYRGLNLHCRGVPCLGSNLQPFGAWDMLQTTELPGQAEMYFFNIFFSVPDRPAFLALSSQFS